SAHHLNVGIRNRQDACTSPRSRRYRIDGFAAARLDDRIARKKRRKLIGADNGSYARPAASVWNTKGFVQIQMADVCSNLRRIGKAALRLHIGAVHIHPAAKFVDHLAYLLDILLKDAVC